MSVLRNLREELTGVVALLVLGAGFLAMAFPTLSPIPFWVIWIVGFAVVLPLVGIATGEALDEDEDADRDPSDQSRRDRDPAAESDRDPLAELRRRYAEGEIDELEFERRLERLLETEDEAAAAAYVDRRRTDREQEADPERDSA
jgi:uncharacterized membrane protein